MMKLVVTSSVSLDGVMQSPGMPDEDPTDFEHGGWLVPYASEEMSRIEAPWVDAADAFLLGRRTYQIMAAYWPHHDEGDAFPDSGSIAAKLNRLPKYVVSTTLHKLDWHNSTPITGDVAEEAAKLKRQSGNELQIHGSGELVRTLMGHNLIDEYRLWICPVVLGKGKRLFDTSSTPTALKLIDVNSVSTGAALHVYRPTGVPTHGSFRPAGQSV